jgi:uncharacterized protein
MTKPQKGALETRTALAGSIRTNESKFQISGIAAAYNSLSQNLGGYREKISPGAFSRSLRVGADVKCLVNHDPSQLLGRTKSGTLVLSDSPEGLRFTVQLDRTNTDHVNTYAAIKRGDMDQCSFAFTVPAGGDTWDDSDGSDPKVMAIRTLRDVDLMDVSAVTYPAYEGTSVGARAAKTAATKSKRFGSHITVEAADGLRKHQCAVIGEAIRAEDSRALSAENVSSIVREHMTEALTKSLAGMGHGYVTHNADFVYSLPEDMPDPDEDCRVAKWQYFINDQGEVELKAARYDAEANPEGPDVEVKARPVREEIRENAKLKKRMRESAGIFSRR